MTTVDQGGPSTPQPGGGRPPSAWVLIALGGIVATVLAFVGPTLILESAEPFWRAMFALGVVTMIGAFGWWAFTAVRDRHRRR